jgi:predicted transposase/invertase (TIGR01784 family)
MKRLYNLYYWSRLYSGQLTSGADYLKLKKTICINILNYKTLETDSFQSIFHLREDKTGLKLSDDIEIHIIEMPKFEFAEIDYNDKLKNWFLFLKDPNSKSMEVFMEREEGVKKAMTVLELLSQDTAER